MSRGLGRVERAVLRGLHGKEERVSLEVLRWELFEQENGGEADVDLPLNWDSAFRRAALSLKGKGYLKIERQSLKSFEECCQHYPGKSHKADVRQLRRRLLPVLAEWGEEHNGLPVRYNEADNEEYYARQLGEEERLQLSRRWEHLEPKLRKAFSAKGDDTLLLLMCKVRYRLGNGGVNVPRSVTSLVDFCCSELDLPAETVRQLKSLAADFFPSAIADSLKLKSMIYRLCEVPGKGSNGVCKLRLATMQFLHRRAKDFVEAMQGFQSSERRFFPETHFSPDLHKLFDAKVFEKFSFLTPIS